MALIRDFYDTFRRMIVTSRRVTSEIAEIRMNYAALQDGTYNRRFLIRLEDPVYPVWPRLRQGGE